MTQRCPTCGAELFGGQQFCRQCGASVGASREEAATQLLGGGTQPQPSGHANTSSVWDSGTEPVGARQSPAFQQPTAYQPPLASFQQTSPLAPQPARRKRGGLWFVALLVVFLLGAGVAGVGAFVWWRAHRSQVIVVKKGADGVRPAEVPEPPFPPDFGERLGEQIRKAMEGVGAAAPLDESGATVSGDQTVLTKTYHLDDDATFAVRAANGSVTITGTDGDEAEVKITKSGGSAELRSAARVMLAQTEGALAFISAGSPPGVKLSYEVKLPRGLHRVEIAADKGDVKVNEFNGSVGINLREGNISVSANGAVRTNLVNGKTSVIYGGLHEEPQEFSVVNGDVDVFLPGSGHEVDLKAVATNGRVEVDDMIAAKAEKRGAGQRVEAELGGGGAPLNVRVVNGNIRLKP